MPFYMSLESYLQNMLDAAELAEQMGLDVPSMLDEMNEDSPIPIVTMWGRTFVEFE